MDLNTSLEELSWIPRPRILALRRLALGTVGDCFTLSTTYIDDSVNAKPQLASLCGPVSTLHGPATIMALGLGSPAYDGLGVGYAVSVSRGTVRLTAHLSDGVVMPVTPVVVEGGSTRPSSSPARRT